METKPDQEPSPPAPRTDGLSRLIKRLTSGPETLLAAPDRPPWSPALAAVFALGLALRLPWLGGVPNPWGHEGDLPLRALGLAPSVPGFGSAVVTAFTASAFALFGPSFGAARLVMVTVLVALVAAAATLLRRRPAIAFALVLLAHPWSVAWSRSGLYPAAFSLGLAALGPVAWWYAVRSRATWGLVLAAQVLALGLHFSPLALLPALACVAWVTLPARRPLFQWRATWIALATGLAHGALALWFAPRSGMAVRAGFLDTVRAIIGALGGSSTLRYFAGSSDAVEALVAVATLLLVALSVRRVLADDFGRFAGVQLLVAMVGLPLIGLHRVDGWGFVLLAPWAMWCAAWARTRHERAYLGPGSLALAVTAAVGSHFLQGSSIDLSLHDNSPGGRFWAVQVPAERRAIPELVRAAVLDDARGAPAVVTWTDPNFEPLRFVLAASPDRRILGASMDEAVPAGRRVYRVTDGRWVLMGWHRVHRWTMTGGLPLAAVWALDEP